MANNELVRGCPNCGESNEPTDFCPECDRPMCIACAGITPCVWCEYEQYQAQRKKKAVFEEEGWKASEDAFDWCGDDEDEAE